MKISYVLPVYNGIAFIHQTVKSLMDQTNQDCEIIIVNDGSTDMVKDLNEYYRQFPKIKWIDICHMGAGYARNIGNNHADGEIISVCDCGDIYHKSKGEEVIKFFDENKDISIVYSHVRIVSSIGEILYAQEATVWDGNSKPPISHPTVSYRKEVARQIKYHEDSRDTDFYEFFMLKAFRKGFKFGIIPRILCDKTELSDCHHARNMMKAKELKANRYKEYGIELKV